MKYIIYIFISIQSICTFAQSNFNSSSVLYYDGVVHLGTGEKYNHGALITNGKKIEAVIDLYRSTIDTNLFDSIIYLKGQHLYPGLISLNSTLGLAEIDAVRATRDVKEIGYINPHVRSIIAYNVESKIIETVRSNGVLLAQITPRGGRISGQSSIVKLHAKNWHEAIIKENDGIHINWPKRWYRSQLNEYYSKQVEELKNHLQRAKQYSLSKGENKNTKLEALKGLYTGSKKLYIHTNDAQEILDVIHLKKEFHFKQLVIVGAEGSYQLTQELKDNSIELVIKRIHSLPKFDDDDINLPFKLAKLLNDKKIPFTLDVSGDMERMNSRNLPFYAATTVAYGLSEEEALRSLTLDAAKILSIDNLYGSLETGKSATFFISKGSIMDIQTHQVSYIVIDGEYVSSTNFQEDLYKKYND